MNVVARDRDLERVEQQTTQYKSLIRYRAQSLLYSELGGYLPTEFEAQEIIKWHEGTGR